MAQAKVRVFALGILAMLVLAGCSNPAMASFSGAAVESQPAESGSKTITLYLSAEEEDGSRTSAGLDGTRIPLLNIRNFIQIVALDKETGAITSVAEARKKKTTDPPIAELRINRLKKGGTYHILLLQGHWNYTGINGSDEFVYDANSPTLLATGFSPDNTIPLDTGTLSVTIDLDPIWIDTAFFDEAGHSGDLSSVEPYIYTDIDTPEVKTVSTSGLIPINDWSVEFRVYGEGDDIGVHNLLDAQMAIGIPAPIALQGISPVLWIKDPAAGSTLSQIDNPGILSRGGIGHESGGYLDYIFTYIIPAIYTNGITRVGTEGYVNFNLKYTPFAKTTAADWQSAIGQPLSKFFTVPEWIIRNGVNDKPQNERTNFEDPGLPSGNPNTGLNWNGSIPFAVAYLRSTPPPGFDYIDPFPPDDTDADGYDPDWQDPNFLYHWPPKLVLTDGGWDNIDSSTGIGTISFNAKGDTYSDPFFSATKPANWYYTVKPTADPPVTPLISEINSVPSSLEETITPGVMQRQIQISGYVPGQDYDVWVIAIKDYVVSSPLLISGSEGSMIVDWDFD